MSISNLKSELSSLSLFEGNKNAERLKETFAVLDDVLAENTVLLGYYIQSEYDILVNQDYLIINLLLENEITEISFRDGSYRIDILKIHHDAGPVLNSDGQSMGAISTLLFAGGNEIHKLKEFEKKIRKKIFSI
jgi:hypothetical protein